MGLITGTGWSGECEKKNIPLFNLSIKLKGWEGPFRDFNAFLNIAEIAQKYRHLQGGKHITQKGAIEDGLVIALHIFEAEFDFGSPTQIHYGKSEKILSLKDPKTIDITKIILEPVYTLEGLYSHSLPEEYLREPRKGEKYVHSKIGILSKIFPSYAEEVKAISVLSKNQKGLLEVLENKYKREISDQ